MQSNYLVQKKKKKKKKVVDHFLGLTGSIVLFERVEDKRLNKEKQTTTKK